MAKRIRYEVGVPDILINNAGIGRWRFLPETCVEEIAETMALPPYSAAAWITQAFLPAMLARISHQADPENEEWRY